MKNTLSDKGTRLFIILGGFFIANAIIAEFIGVKIFSLEKTFGFEPLSMGFFGEKDLAFSLTAGTLLWPIVFIMTDIINEYFGIKGVKMLSYLAVGLIGYGFVMVYFAIGLEPAGFWPTSHISTDLTEIQQQEIQGKVSDYDFAFKLVFGQGLWIIAGSIIAFLIGQMVDVFTFHKIKEKTGNKYLWLRATGSTLVSQFVDSFVVLIIAFYIGANWSLVLVLAIGTVNYIFKFVIAILLTPSLYLIHNLIDNYLGLEKSKKMKDAALLNS
ncbi:queuosine precursor transporter [Saprospiraceae bacterium]|nr:queuosine precursor transporter [Saprospiraceae bacterium]MDG1435580.1 queuosine precursor transporter [Saprospiraceae bacterium]